MRAKGQSIEGGVRPRLGAVLGIAGSVVLVPSLAQAQGVDAESGYLLSTLLALLSGMVVMFMAAGFCMLEAGMVRAKNAATICVKNISLYSIASLAYFLVGYNLMYTGVDGGWIGTPTPFQADDTAALAGDFSAGSSSAAAWFFQMVFVATAASIVSGTLAERIRLWPFLIFVLVLTAFIYPVQGSWKWGEGWLHQMGFSDFAGSTLVHSVGGWAALTGAVILGPRAGRYIRGRARPMPGSSLPLATLGTFILWMGWFGFNGGSQLAFGSGADAVAVGRIFANTNTAAAAGVVAAMAVAQLRYKRVDLTLALNGAIGGLVAITAQPLTPSLPLALFIGAVGGVLIAVTVPLLDRLKIDDVVGAIPAHLVCGIWGTLAVVLSEPGTSVWVQLLGIVTIGAFVSAVSAGVWYALARTMGLRTTAADELAGLDQSELAMEAYPEFLRAPSSS